MKKILFILSLVCGFGLASQAQVFPLSAQDSLINVDSVSYVIDARNAKPLDLLLTLALNRVSGTGTIKTNVYTTSFLKENYVHVYSDAVGTSATKKNYQVAYSSIPLHRYVKVTVSQTGTAKTVPRLAYTLRER